MPGANKLFLKLRNQVKNQIEIKTGGKLRCMTRQMAGVIQSDAVTATRKRGNHPNPT